VIETRIYDHLVANHPLKISLYQGRIAVCNLDPFDITGSILEADSRFKGTEAAVAVEV